MVFYIFKLCIIWLATIIEDGYGYQPPMEYYHFPFVPELERKVNGTDLPKYYDTPDFRIQEPPWVPFIKKKHFYKEEQRPYRISPYYKMQYTWNQVRPFFGSNQDHVENLGCYCCTVFKRFTPLAGCAVLTTRHLLTTATSTELVLKDYAHGPKPHVNEILGAWYDHNADRFNSSMYMTPARIHYHPRYLHPNLVNTTHPLPFTFDLAVWASTHPFLGGGWNIFGAQVVVCPRGSPHRWQYLSSTPRGGDLAHIVGYQFMKAYNRRPLPWHKYVVRTRQHMNTCPKTEWGWMHCIYGNWAKYGIESGAAWSRALEGRYWLYDGLIGMCAFTMQLRSENLIHYFTVLNSNVVLDFLYESYVGWLPYRFLDYRFYNSQGQSPFRKPWAYIPNHNEYGAEVYKGTALPWY